MSQGPQTPRDLYQRIRNIERAQRSARMAPFAAQPITTWEDMDLPLSTGWVPFGAPYSAPQYYKDHAGVVHLRGVIKNGDVGPVFQFDSGFIPDQRSVHMALGAGLSIARVDVLKDGTLQMVGFADSSLIALDGIHWRAAS